MDHQTCKVCGQRDKFNFHVPDEIWQRVVPEAFVNRVVCLPCFDEFARQRDVDYAHHVTSLYFVGDRGNLEFATVSALHSSDRDALPA